MFTVSFKTDFYVNCESKFNSYLTENAVPANFKNHFLTLTPLTWRIW